MTDDGDFVRITLRIPKNLHEQLNDAAAKKRSMNAEIIARLEGSFSAQPMDPRAVAETFAAVSDEVAKLQVRIRKLREERG